MQEKALQLSWRPPIWAKAPHLAIALRSPSTSGRIAANIRLSGCPRVPTSGIDKAVQGAAHGKRCGRHARNGHTGAQSAQPKAYGSSVQTEEVGTSIFPMGERNGRVLPDPSPINPPVSCLPPSGRVRPAGLGAGPRMCARRGEGQANQAPFVTDPTVAAASHEPCHMRDASPFALSGKLARATWWGKLATSVYETRDDTPVASR
nr:unnamed protein product [Digitaria exilis]